MNAEEVKIVVRSESQGNGLRSTKEELEQIASSGKKASEATQKVASGKPHPGQVTSASGWDKKPQTPDAKASAARNNRALIADAEQDLAQARATGAAPTVIAQRERELRERKLAARFMREQGVGEEEALDKAGSLVGSQQAAKARAAAEKEAGKERTAAEKKATQEMQEQERISKRMTMRIGGMAGSAAVVMGGELLAYQFEMQGNEARDKATRQMNARQLQIQSGARGTSGQVQAEAWAAQDEVAALKANRPALEIDAKKSLWMRGLQGAGAGLMAGAMTGNPYAAVGGAVVGGISGAFGGHLEGKAALAKNDLAIKTKEKEAEDKGAQATKKALEEETSLEIDAIHARSTRTLSGIRQAQTDDLVRSGMQTYRKLTNAGVKPEAAKQAALEDTQNQLRDKQISAASSLVNARAGARDIAAAARWGQMVTPGMNDVARVLGQKLDGLHDTVKSGNTAAQNANLEDFTK